MIKMVLLLLLLLLLSWSSLLLFLLLLPMTLIPHDSSNSELIHKKSLINKRLSVAIANCRREMHFCASAFVQLLNLAPCCYAAARKNAFRVCRSDIKILIIHASEEMTDTSSLSSISPSPSEIDELASRSRNLTKILKKNVNKADKRKSVLEVVRDKAWLLENQAKALEKQTKYIRNSLARQSCRRRLLVLAAVILSLFLIINRSIVNTLFGIFSSKNDEEDINHHH